MTREVPGRTLNVNAIPLDQHVALNKAQRILVSGGGTLELRDEEKRILECKFDTETSNRGSEALAFGERVLLQIQAIINSAGGGELLLTAKEIDSQIEAVNFVYDLITSSESIQIGLLIRPSLS